MLTAPGVGCTVPGMVSNPGWQPRHDDPLYILAMDHRESFGKTLFGVKDDEPEPDQFAAMTAAKQLIFEGLQAALPSVKSGRIGVLVDERYGQGVIDAVRGGGQPLVLAVPVEASGHDWFTLEWGEAWLTHVEAVKPDYAKVLIRDNPDFDAARREAQFGALAKVSAGLREAGVPLLYELLVPATEAQLARADHDGDTFDHDIRPGLVARVIADNHAHGIEPALWKVEGLETLEAARQVADQAKAGDRTADLIVLGRDAPAERLDHWLEVASQVDAFVGFAIGRSIWEYVVSKYEASDHDDAARSEARAKIAERYLGFIAHWAPDEHAAD
jgi:myo-inositol catabolism protein IolC